MFWLLLIVPTGLLLWGAWPRPVKGGEGRGVDESNLVASGSPPAVLRFGTFNIHGGKGLDGARNLSRIATDLVDIDIAALQEVHDSWRAKRQLHHLSERLEISTLNAPARKRWFRLHRSNALLTKYSPGAWTRLRLFDPPGWRSSCRNLTIVQMTQPSLHVLLTHLNRKDGRDEQLAQVMHMFLRYSPAVLMGDLNVRRDDPVIGKYLARGDITDALSETLDNDDPARIDWILCRGVNAKNGGVIDSGASDHPLYWCDIEVGQG